MSRPAQSCSASPSADLAKGSCGSWCLQHSVKESTWARVRSFAEIERTLDSEGRTEGLPFMPEMLDFCGRAFRVRKAANICLGGYRRIERVWHLEGPRCSGAAHGGCQAQCLLYWHESWLESAFNSPSAQTSSRSPINLLHCFDSSTNRYTCQLTEAGRLGTRLSEPTLREHVNSYLTGRLRWSDVRALAAFCYSRLLFALLRRVNWPSREPEKIVNRELRVGDVVKVRSRASVLRSLNKEGFHKGLSFRPDMLRFCGRTFRIMARVDRIIDEYTGELREIKNTCYILDGVMCEGEWKLCTRMELYYWRRQWLEKVADAAPNS